MVEVKGNWQFFFMLRLDALYGTSSQIICVKFMSVDFFTKKNTFIFNFSNEFFFCWINVVWITGILQEINDKGISVCFFYILLFYNRFNESVYKTKQTQTLLNKSKMVKFTHTQSSW